MFEKDYPDAEFWLDESHFEDAERNRHSLGAYFYEYNDSLDMWEAFDMENDNTSLRVRAPYV